MLDNGAALPQHAAVAAAGAASPAHLRPRVFEARARRALPLPHALRPLLRRGGAGVLLGLALVAAGAALLLLSGDAGREGAPRNSLQARYVQSSRRRRRPDSDASASSWGLFGGLGSVLPESFGDLVARQCPRPETKLLKCVVRLAVGFEVSLSSGRRLLHRAMRCEPRQFGALATVHPLSAHQARLTSPVKESG